VPGVTDIVERLALSPDQAEANPQADIRALLFEADLGLDEAESPLLELPTPSGRRIDVQIGATVIEVKRRIAANRLQEWEEQLAGYVRERQSESGQRWSGILTDGREWRLYTVSDESIQQAGDPHFVRPDDPDALVHWLGAVLAARRNIQPTPLEIASRLGIDSPTFKSDLLALAELHVRNSESPNVAVKRDLWSRLLSDAFGREFAEDPAQADLFVRHTYLVVVAEIIAHRVLGFSPTMSARDMLAGKAFWDAQIHGVIEQDFFDWVIEVPGGTDFVEGLVRRIAQFDFSAPQHDVLKVLYETVIDSDTRRRLGEYYTPDWLAHEIVEAVIDDPINQRILDPACGSGTFLFWSVKHYLHAAEAENQERTEALARLPHLVSGMDLHPVAVTLARVTYLMAIGPDWLESRPAPFSVPVFLADAMTWRQPERLHTSSGIVISTAPRSSETGAMPLWHEDIVLDDELLSDPPRFDALIAELAERATTSQVLGNVLRRYAVPEHLRDQVTAVFERFCELHRIGRDHVWGYFVRNHSRPRAFQRDPVDRLVGNPPWLSYRKMTEPVRTTFREESLTKGLWAGGRSASQMDLSAYFVATSVARYLKPDGHFGFVMPSAVLNQRQYSHFRSGEWGGVNAQFSRSWRLTHVKSDPPFFPVPSSVIFGSREELAHRMPTPIADYRGRLPRGSNHSMAVARGVLSMTEATVKLPSDRPHPYRDEFRNGATLYPRNLVFVVNRDPGPLGPGPGRSAVQSYQSPQANRPWRDLAPLTGAVENVFLHPVYLGENVLPYRTTTALRAIIPWDGAALIDPITGDAPQGVSDWWLAADALWRSHAVANRGEATDSLLNQLDYLGKLSDQFPTSARRVVYSKAGTHLAAAIIEDPQAVIDHNLYWSHITSESEALYLIAVFNSPSFHDEVQGFQPVGLFGPRHFDKYVFEVPFPRYTDTDPLHVELAATSRRAIEVANSVELPTNLHFTRQRSRVRTALSEDGVAQTIDELVLDLLTRPTET
jgi:hypothetical protein